MDDDAENCRNIQMLMSNTEVVVDTATSGKEALCLLWQKMDTDQAYNMILLDWKMPDMNGVETAKEIRNTISDTLPILFLTAYDGVDVEDEICHIEHAGILAKPFFVSAFKEKILEMQTAGESKEHTPDALEKVFESIKGHPGRIIAVHGGAGQRDSSTRAMRGEILGRESDIVIITEDDSRDEDPAEIAQMFVDGVMRHGKVLGRNLFVELDRRKAIEKAIGMARTGDLVLLLGKGHEKTILRADGPHDFEDIKVAQEVLRSAVS